MVHEHMIDVLVSWRDKNLKVEMDSSSDVKELGLKLVTLTNVKPETMKLLIPLPPSKGSKLLIPFSSEHSSLPLENFANLQRKPIRMLGSFEDEIQAVSQKDSKSDSRIIGFDEEEKRMMQRLTDSPHSSLKLPHGAYIFCNFRTLRIPGIELTPPDSEALKRMHMLACDPGIIAIMNKHRWRVEIMTEMAPVGYVGISPKCLLGFNKNRGEEISLRLRTDDLKGFRKYQSIKKTLLHELAHMVYTEHDENFYSLDKQLNEEASNLDWTKSKSHTLSGKKISNYYGGEVDVQTRNPSTGLKLGGANLMPSKSARASSVTAAYNRFILSSTSSSEESNTFLRSINEDVHHNGISKDDPDPDERIVTMIPDHDDRIFQMKPDPDESVIGPNTFLRSINEDVHHNGISKDDPNPDERIVTMIPDHDDRIIQMEPDPDESVIGPNIFSRSINNDVHRNGMSKHEPDPDDGVLKNEPDPDESIVKMVPDPDNSIIKVKSDLNESVIGLDDPLKLRSWNMENGYNDFVATVDDMIVDRPVVTLDNSASTTYQKEIQDEEFCSQSENMTYSFGKPDLEDSLAGENILFVEELPDPNDRISGKTSVNHENIKEQFPDASEQLHQLHTFPGKGHKESNPDYCMSDDIQEVQNMKSEPDAKTNMTVKEKDELERIEEPVVVICRRLQKAIESLRSESTEEETAASLQTLLKIIRNVIEHPNDMMFGRLRKGNRMFQKTVANHKAAMEILTVVGFCEDILTDEGRSETYMVLKRNDPGLLWLAKSSLELALG